MALVDPVSANDLAAVERYLQLAQQERGRDALLNEITTCEHEARELQTHPNWASRNAQGRNAKSAVHRAAMLGRWQILERFLREEAVYNEVNGVVLSSRDEPRVA